MFVYGFKNRTQIQYTNKTITFTNFLEKILLLYELCCCVNNVILNKLLAYWLAIQRVYKNIKHRVTKRFICNGYNK